MLQLIIKFVHCRIRKVLDKTSDYKSYLIITSNCDAYYLVYLEVVAAMESRNVLVAVPKSKYEITS
jgi:hypothetical protein